MYKLCECENIVYGKVNVFYCTDLPPVNKRAKQKVPENEQEDDIGLKAI